MTQDKIIEMAKQAGMDYLKYISPEAFEKVTVFANLVAQHERKACAKECDACICTAQASEAIRARRQA